MNELILSLSSICYVRQASVDTLGVIASYHSDLDAIALKYNLEIVERATNELTVWGLFKIKS